MSELEVITAGIPAKDNCPVLTRIKAFLVQEGTAPYLEYVFRSRDGRPLDLRGAADPVPGPSLSSDTSGASTSSTASQSSTSSQAAPAEDAVLVRIREAIGIGADDSQRIWRVAGIITDAANGVVRAKLGASLCGQSGLYQMDWAFVRNSDVVLINNTLLSIEPTLFGAGNNLRPHTLGCPTIQEIRMQMVDSAPAENSLLDDVEFGDDQILQAIVKPVQYFNQQPPPLGYFYNTTNFPWKQAWIDATIGYLMGFAAATYRRNRLGGSAAGINIDDMNKENEYLREAERRGREWKDFVLQKKVELNMQQGAGGIGSPYRQR